MKDVVYDSGVLIAADRNERATWAEHRVRLEAGQLPLVPAGVVAQVSRSPKQVQLRRFLRGTEIVPLDASSAHRAGALLGKSGTRDVVDATVTALAIDRGAEVLSDDPDDLRRLLHAGGSALDVRRR
jgi:predicted nucleic acid-binding protein